LPSLEDSDCILFVGVDLKKELPLLNSRFRSSFLRDKTVFATMGSTTDSGFPMSSAGLSLDDFSLFVGGNHPFCASFAQAKTPKIILSSSLFEQAQSGIIKSILSQLSLANHLDSINVLNLHASSVGCNDSGRFNKFVAKQTYSTLFFIGVDPFEDLSFDSLV